MKYEHVALIVAAGRGERAGGAVPKQFAPLLGVPVVARAVDAFCGMPAFVVIGAGQRALLVDALGARRVEGVVEGGATRQASVLAGLEAIAVAGGATRVFVHDAARPLLSRIVLDRLRAALDGGADGVVPVLPVVDTVAHISGARISTSLGETIARDDLVRVQTPQAFAFAPLLAAHRAQAGNDRTDDAQVARAAGLTVVTVEGDEALAKLTHPDDFARAERGLAERLLTERGLTKHLVSRSAMGFDVHRLEPGLPLWLCGVRIEHSHGLSGHSDADVGLHALTDALLGSVGEGDIGTHFPPSDPQWRGAASARFVDHARQLIEARGGVIDHVDVTLICESPRIGPHRDAMRARLSEILRLPVARISLKATTTEGLGFTGRGEGIAAQAIVTVRLWESV